MLARRPVSEAKSISLLDRKPRLIRQVMAMGPLGKTEDPVWATLSYIGLRKGTKRCAQRVGPLTSASFNSIICEMDSLRKKEQGIFLSAPNYFARSHPLIYRGNSTDGRNSQEAKGAQQPRRA